MKQDIENHFTWNVNLPVSVELLFWKHTILDIEQKTEFQNVITRVSIQYSNQIHANVEKCKILFRRPNIWIMHETQAYRSGAKVTYCILQNTLTFFSYMGDFRFINFSITVFINSYLYEYVLSKYNYCNWREKSDKDENVWNDAKNKNI